MITSEVLTKKRAEYVARLQELENNIFALQGAIQAIDELSEIENSLTVEELTEALDEQTSN